MISSSHFFKKTFLDLEEVSHVDSHAISPWILSAKAEHKHKRTKSQQAKPLPAITTRKQTKMQTEPAKSIDLPIIESVVELPKRKLRKQDATPQKFVERYMCYANRLKQFTGRWISKTIQQQNCYNFLSKRVGKRQLALATLSLQQIVYDDTKQRKKSSTDLRLKGLKVHRF